MLFIQIGNEYIPARKLKDVFGHWDVESQSFIATFNFGGDEPYNVEFRNEDHYHLAMRTFAHHCNLGLEILNLSAFLEEIHGELL